MGMGWKRSTRFFSGIALIIIMDGYDNVVNKLVKTKHT